MTHSALLHVIVSAVMKASKPLIRDFGEVDRLQVSKKGTANFVTNADIRTERILVEELSRARPAFGFVNEEGGVSGSDDAEHRFIIDPIDGTNNFIHAIPYFCISVGVERQLADGGSEIIAGVIYDPVQDELFVATKGEGATLNNRRIVVSQRTEDCFYSTTVPRPSHPDFVPMQQAMQRVSASGAAVRCSGAAALDLAYVAAGRYDAIWYHHLKPWDIAAGSLMVEEAGGMVSNISGQPTTCHQSGLIAGNKQVHRTLVGLLNG